MSSNLEKLVLELYNIEVLKFGNFTLKSGVSSPIYFDLRLIISHPKLMDLLTNLQVELIRNSVTEKFQHVCGVPYTALPMATLISAKTGVPMLIRRKEAKNHGLKKLIEGVFKSGDECVIIEDVISSGSSIIETVNDLKNAGLKVTNAIVVLDREQGGLQNLQNNGIKVQVLLSLSQILETLLKHSKITQETVDKVREYISSVRLTSGNMNSQAANGIKINRLQMKFSDRAKLAKNKLAARIFNLIEDKKSLLCLAADVKSTSELLTLANQVGPHICILKTHFDMLEDFSKNSFINLMKIAKNHNFLIMEDRKFSDIGNTVSMQYDQIKPWSDLITAHSLCGEGTLKGLKSCIESDEEKGCFLVAQLSCEGQLIDSGYSRDTLKMAETYSDFVVGLVCQSSELITEPYLIQLTPGVKIEERSDSLGQNYSDPESVVLTKGADIAVVGRGIVSSPNPEKAAITYKDRLWSAYLKRIT